jgi:DNA-binding IclR family transcriptional regulator
MSGKQVPLSGSAERVSYLARLLDVLESVAEAARPLGLSELAGAASVPISTASRLVTLLSERGYLQRLPSGGYLPGPRLVHLALYTIRQLHGADRLDVATRTLAGEVDESVSAGLLLGAEIVLVAREESTHPLRVVARVGDIVAPHTSAMGKAILAHLDPARRGQVVAAAVGAERAEAILAELAPELEVVARVGYACDEQTYAPGQRCRAVALLDHNGQAFGGVSIAGPAARFTFEKAEETIPALRAQAAAISLTVPASEVGGPTATILEARNAPTPFAGTDTQEAVLPG